MNRPRRVSGVTGTSSVPTDETTLDLNSAFFAAVRATSKSSESYMAGLNLTSARVAVISILHRQPDKRLTVGEIAMGLHVSSTNISRRLDGLEKAGWVQRERNPEDGRSIYISLTPVGTEKAEAILPAIYRRLNDIWSCFDSNEKEELTGLLNRFLEHLHTVQSVSPLGGK
ncbi:MAG TPA: MarR family transcriptional regulator [Dehalococcoidia bacterium]|jgi:DNA-binding MarR family transcriptional regulator|nr:MarR family transcriptional regulator [Dehalococcoidia bacterium]